MNWIEHLCKQFSIKVKYEYGIPCSGHANIRSRTIVLNKEYIKINNTNSQTLSIVCHEIVHILAADNNKFKNTHGSKRHLFMRKLGLKMERYVDKKAEEFFNSAYPELKYLAGYDTEESAKWYRKHVLDAYFPKKKRRY